MIADIEDRFWNKVRIGDGCWEWTGSGRTLEKNDEQD